MGGVSNDPTQLVDCSDTLSLVLGLGGKIGGDPVGDLGGDLGTDLGGDLGTGFGANFGAGFGANFGADLGGMSGADSSGVPDLVCREESFGVPGLGGIGGRSG